MPEWYSDDSKVVLLIALSIQLLSSSSRIE